MTGRGGAAGRVRGAAVRGGAVTGGAPRGAAARARGAGALGLPGALGLLGVLALAGCGAGVPPEASPAPGTSSSAAPAADEAVVWPVAELTVLVAASGPGTPPDEAELHDLTTAAEQDGRPLEDVVAVYQHQDDFAAFADRVRGAFPQTWSSTAFTSPEGDPAWVAFTGAVPAEAVELAQGLPLDVELRGGAALSDAERETAMGPAVDAFAEDTDTGHGWSAGLDAPTARFTVSYVPGGPEEPDEGTAAAMIAAARAAIGRDAPFTVELAPDTTDPLTTNPAVWFLPVGFVPDPAATSVEVLVSEEGCTSGQGAAGNTAEPEVEVTATEVRIAISTYVRLGGATCPGHPLAPVVVDLGGPLGDRVLVDAHGTVDDAHAPPESVYGGGIVVPPSVPAAGG